MQATVFHQAAYLDQDQLEPARSCCPFCDSPDRTPLGLLQSNPDVQLLRCNRCQAASASRMPTAGALADYYGQYYHQQSTKVTTDAPDNIARHIFRGFQRFRSTPRNNSGNYTILDYGGGDGTIALGIGELLLENGAAQVSILVIDYHQQPVRSSSPRITLRWLEDIGGIASASMDLVLASAVLEHIPDPRPVMTALLNSVKPGGIFYARTPYSYPLMRLARLFNLTYSFTFPAHLHDLGARFWHNINRFIPEMNDFTLRRSTPSVVETSLKQHPLRTISAQLLKLPGYLFKQQYGLIGGWEVFLHKFNTGA